MKGEQHDCQYAAEQGKRNPCTDKKNKGKNWNISAHVNAVVLRR